jgi:hypothetical protein
VALGRRMPLLAILPARAWTGGAPAVAGALRLIANQFPGSMAHPTLAKQQPTNDADADEGEKRGQTALLQNTDEDFDQKGQ